MNRELAERTAIVVSQSSFVLDFFLSELNEKLEPDEFREYCKKFASIMSESYFQVHDPLWTEHPDLRPQKMGGPYQTNDQHYRNIYDLVISQAKTSNS